MVSGVALTKLFGNIVKEIAAVSIQTRKIFVCVIELFIVHIS